MITHIERERERSIFSKEAVLVYILSKHIPFFLKLEEVGEVTEIHHQIMVGGLVFCFLSL